jgi:hypothetical protein
MYLAVCIAGILGWKRSGIRQSSALCERFSASNSAPAQGQRNSQKIYPLGTSTSARHPLGNGEDQQGGVIVPVGTIEIRQSAEDFYYWPMTKLVAAT